MNPDDTTPLPFATADEITHRRVDETDPLPLRSTTPRRIGISFRGSYERRIQSGFMSRYLSGDNILDVGFRGGDPDAVPITEAAIGVDLDYPGYDGTHLPFPDQSQDAVLAAHVLEHIWNHREVLQEWYRVLRPGGYLVVIVPHRHLYERRCDLPSRWNGDHKRFYTPASLLAEVEEALPVNGYRVRHAVDNDYGYDYRNPPDSPPQGGYEIELVLQRIARPSWADSLSYPAVVQQTIEHLDSAIFAAVAAMLQNKTDCRQFFGSAGQMRYFTPWVRMRQHFVAEGASELGGSRVTLEELREVVAKFLPYVAIDEEVYKKHGDLRRAFEQGVVTDLTRHWRTNGYFENRAGHEYVAFVANT